MNESPYSLTSTLYVCLTAKIVDFSNDVPVTSKRCRSVRGTEQEAECTESGGTSQAEDEEEDEEAAAAAKKEEEAEDWLEVLEAPEDLGGSGKVANISVSAGPPSSHLA